MCPAGESFHLRGFLSDAWQAATDEERRELVQIILAEVRFDLTTGQVVKVKPNPEYVVLFDLMGGDVSGRAELM